MTHLSQQFPTKPVQVVDLRPLVQAITDLGGQPKLLMRKDFENVKDCGQVVACTKMDEGHSLVGNTHLPTARMDQVPS